MIGLLTFHWADDYGAMLQAYALKHSLEKLGGEVEVIPYAPRQLTGRYQWYPFVYRDQEGKAKLCLKMSIKQWRRDLFPNGVFLRRRKAMAQFRRRYLTARSPLRRVKDISLEQYACVFVGSDQVWNPEITVVLDDAYIGNIPARGSCRLISYAASMGGTTLPAKDREKFALYVGTAFTGISLRERSAVPFVEELLGRAVTEALDPVLLLKRREWEEIAASPKEDGYVLIYQTECSKPLMEYARRIARLSGKTVVSVNFFKHDRWIAEWAEQRTGIGPAEFIGYIQNAACVVTNSFHGTAFSILLEKPFAVFSHSTRNARINDLLEKTGLCVRQVTETSVPACEWIWEPIHWPEVRSRLSAEREHSIQFIRNHINGGQ